MYPSLEVVKLSKLFPSIGMMSRQKIFSFLVETNSQRAELLNYLCWTGLGAGVLCLGKFIST